MQRGKKSLAQRIVYGAIETVTRSKRRRSRGSPAQALENASPRLEVKSRRVGGATYQVPDGSSAGAPGALAMRWIVAAAKRKGVPLKDALATEIIDASNGR